jgi:hypothetical protein
MSAEWKNQVQWARDALADILKDRFSGIEVQRVRHLLPYCLHPVSNEDATRLIWLNRSYQPLGVEVAEWINYADYQSHHVMRDDDLIQPLLAKCEKTPRQIFFLWQGQQNPRKGRKQAARLLSMLDMVLKSGGNAPC